MPRYPCNVLSQAHDARLELVHRSLIALAGVQRVLQRRQDAQIIDRRVQFGRVLAAARQARRISQTELGRRLGGVVQATISSWEGGITIPTVEQLFALEELLEIDLCTVLGRSAPEIRSSRCAADYFADDPNLPEWARPVASAMYIALCKSSEGGDQPGG